MKKWKKYLVVIPGVYLVLFCYLWGMQETMIFFPQPLEKNYRKYIEREKIESFTVENEGEVLKGWIRRAKEPSKAPLIVFFGGNAEEVSHHLLNWSSYGEVSFCTVNYRSYGESTGIPSEKALFSDALKIFDKLMEDKDFDPSRTIIIGRSLGSGVAVSVAAEREHAGLVLLTPYDSILNVAKGRFPIFPMSWVLRHPFDSLSRTEKLTSPILVLTAKGDPVIPNSNTENLVKSLKNCRHVYIETNHDSIMDEDEYFTELLAFISSLKIQ